MRAYKEGIEDFKRGREFWQNPHVEENSAIRDWQAWCAGWMKAKQEKTEKDKKREQEDLKALGLAQ